VKKMPDIDIDFANRSNLLNLLEHRVAILENGKSHNSGVYFTEIPYDPSTNRATIDYKEAESRGYFKIDCLNVSIYQNIKSLEHLRKLTDTPPMWELLEHPEFVNKVFHINGHSDILIKMKPKTLTELAAVLAMIRPAKRHLIGKDWDTVMEQVWTRPDGDEYYFKKSHAVGYAMAVVVHMNLICEEITG
jgi:DNA polymerase III alpha subunit